MALIKLTDLQGDPVVVNTERVVLVGPAVTQSGPVNGNGLPQMMTKVIGKCSILLDVLIPQRQGDGVAMLPMHIEVEGTVEDVYYALRREEPGKRVHAVE